MRLIARLDIKSDRLVKGIAFEGLRSFGSPELYARHYEREGADELLFMDAVASLYGRNSLLDMIARVSREVFIPLTVGGGLRSLQDIEKVLQAGADKVALNTAAIGNPELITDAAARFGSSTIVVSIEAKLMPDGSYQAFVDNGREPTGRNVLDWACEARGRGAGEIIVTSIDRDGTGTGFDARLIGSVAEAVDIPVIASGGAGSAQHVAQLSQQVKIEGVALASLLHYKAVSEIASEGPPISFSRIQPATINQVREVLRIINVRPKAECALPRSLKPHAMVGIITTGTGNIASVKNAAESVSLAVKQVTCPDDLLEIDGLILPGVGAFGEAMRALHRSELTSAIVDWTLADRPLMGICLGMQLLFAQSEEFGACRGLGVFEGRVRALSPRMGPSVKAPHFGWNTLAAARNWNRSILKALQPNAAMYFMHSFHVEPADHEVVLSATRHGDLEFCSAVQRGNTFGCQFHPERSGIAGLSIYRQFASVIHLHSKKEGRDVHALSHA